MSRCLQNYCFYVLAESSNSAELQRFFVALREQLRPGLTERPHVILDNLRAHLGETRRIIETCFVADFQPTYSCLFNSIESLWANIKRRYRRELMMIAFRQNYSVLTCKRIVRQICTHEIPPQQILNTLTTNAQYIETYWKKSLTRFD